MRAPLTMAPEVEDIIFNLHQAYCPFGGAGPYVACEHFDEYGDDQPAMLK